MKFGKFLKETNLSIEVKRELKINILFLVNFLNE